MQTISSVINNLSNTISDEPPCRVIYFSLYCSIPQTHFERSITGQFNELGGLPCPPPAVWHSCGDHYVAGPDLFVPFTSAAHLSCGGKWRSTLESWDTLCDVAMEEAERSIKGCLSQLTCITVHHSYSNLI